ncbi:MAG: hypothetical protein WD009_05645 [Phycisphaeraceae bacterium]
MHSPSRVAARRIVALALLATGLSDARAIDIIFEPLSQTSHPLILDGTVSYDSENPGHDPNADDLAVLLGHIEDVYESAFIGNDTIRITYWWDSDMTFVGGQSIPAMMFENPQGTLTHSVVRFHPGINAYMDPNPATNNNFNMQQLLYDFGPNALTPQQQTARFSGDVPDVFEAAYNGAATAGDAVGRLDVLSLAFHEVGHSLGMNAGFSGLQNEMADNQFDVDPNDVRGAVMAILPRGTNPDPLDHLNGTDAVMAFLQGSRRTLPSAADYFAIAATQGWDVNLPRVDFLGGGDWHTGFNWMGGDIPFALTDAFVRHDGVVSLSGFGNVRSLTIDNNSSVQTNSQAFQTGALVIQSTVGGGTPRLLIQAGGTLFADDVLIRDNARLDIFGAGAAAHVDHDVIIEAGGELRGNGELAMTGMFGELINDGIIRGSGNGTLVISAVNNLAMDLDGVSEQGEVIATAGNIHFQAGSFDGFNGDMTIGAGRHITTDHTLGLGAGSLLLLDGTANTAATINGPGMLFVGQSAVLRAEGLGVVNNTLVIQNGILEASDNAELRLNGITLFQDGLIAGPGVVRQNGDLDVQSTPVVDTFIYDLDGQANNTTVTIQPGAHLDIRSDQIAMSPINDFHGLLDLRGGRLTIDANWRLDGTLDMTETIGTPTRVSGDGGMTIASGADVNVLGTGRIDAGVLVAGEINVGQFPDPGHLHFDALTYVESTADFDIDSASIVSFNGHTTLVGGSFVGAGRVEFNDTVHVLASTSIGTAETDLDGASESAEITIDPNMTFAINSNTIEPAGRNDGFDGVITNRGVLSVLAGWRLDHRLHMIQPLDRATTPTLAGVGTMRIHMPGLMTTDGDARVDVPFEVAGRAMIDNGTTWVNDVVFFESTADVSVADDAELILNGASSFFGGVYVGSGLMRFNAPADVHAATSIDVTVLDVDGDAHDTQWTLHDAPLTLNSDRLNTINNFFAGTFNVNGDGARLTVNLTAPGAAWRLSGGGILNLTGDGLPAPTLLDGSPVAVLGRINADGRLRIAAQTALHGRLQLNDSTTDVHFGGGLRHLVFEPAILDGPGAITIDNGSDMFLQHGTNVGVDVENLGRLEVGFVPSEVDVDFTTPGQALIRGNFAQGPSGIHRVELAGAAPGSGHDRLDITETARLGGRLELALIDGFEPDLFDMFTILTAGQVINTFVHVDQSDVPAANVFHVHYNPADVMLTYLLLGDMNLDGVVDAIDVAPFVLALTDPLAYEATYGIGPGFVGDINRDGDFDAIDVSPFVELLVSGAASVPEPTSLLTLAVTALMLSRRTSRRGFG